MQANMARSNFLPFLSPCLLGLREASVSPWWDHRSPGFIATVLLAGEISTGEIHGQARAGGIQKLCEQTF